MPCRQERCTLMNTIAQDIRFAVRTLWKAPTFTAVAILALALGIGANSAIFTVVNAVVLRPLPFPDAQRLCVIYTSRPGGLSRYGSVTAAHFLGFREQHTRLEDAAAIRRGSTTLTRRG